MLIELISGSAALLSLPATLALAHCTWGARQKPAIKADAPMAQGSICLLVPAHNEQETLPYTLSALQRACAADGNVALVVIADNCTDQTASLARDFGAIVYERHEPGRRGKGAALADAFARFDEFDWYLIVDADSRLDPGFLSCLRQALQPGVAALQTRYLPLPQNDRWACLRLLALTSFNVLRLRGRAALGESAGILGNGFVLARSTLQQVPFSANSVVEDLEYHLALLAAGLKVDWLEQATVRGEMPTGEGAKVQRARWEGGRLAMWRQHVPRLLIAALRGQPGAWAGLAELCLFPLSMQLGLLLLGLLAGGWSAIVAGSGLAVLFWHGLLVLAELPQASRLRALGSIPAYLWWKLQQLPAIVAHSRRNTPWQRSPRNAKGGV